MNVVLALFAGIMIGVAQILTRNIFLTNNKSLLIITLILCIYILSGLIWIILLKFSGNLALSYAVLILGSFISIILGNNLQISNNFIITSKEVIALFFIFTGCYLLK